MFRTKLKVNRKIDYVWNPLHIFLNQNWCWHIFIFSVKLANCTKWTQTGEITLCRSKALRLVGPDGFRLNWKEADWLEVEGVEGGLCPG